MTKLISYSLFLFIIVICSSICCANDKFIIYYSDALPYHYFEGYSTIVFDSDYHPDIKPLTDMGTAVLGYVNAGEIETYRWYFKKFKNKNVLLSPNDDWDDSYIADIRNNQWSSFILLVLIPGIIKDGFNGVFIDTLDSPISLENENPKKYKGMKQAAYNLIAAIKQRYPKLKIMVNRSYDILPNTAKLIDMELAECLYSDYDFNKKKYVFTSKNDYNDQLTILKKAKKANPDLKIYTLDYWYKNDKKTISKIYQIERKNGFIPYVSTINLDTIVYE